MSDVVIGNLAVVRVWCQLWDHSRVYGPRITNIEADTLVLIIAMNDNEAFVYVSSLNKVGWLYLMWLNTVPQ